MHSILLGQKAAEGRGHGEYLADRHLAEREAERQQERPEKLTAAVGVGQGRKLEKRGHPDPRLGHDCREG